MRQTTGQLGSGTPPLFPLILLFLYAAHTAAAALPITFEENRGQVARGVAFLSRTPGYQVFLLHRGAVITLQDGQTVRVRLANSRDTAPVGTHRLVTRTNYLLGPDAARWRSGIANYDGVTYPQAYPGIDLTWHAQGDQIEHDFLLKAGADARQIDLVFSGAGLRLTPEGDLMAGALRFHKPRAYQKGREVECRYELHGRHVGFAVGPYNATEPLTIDPVLSFSTYLGNGTPVGTALDGAGNLYIVGTTAALGFPGTAGTFQPALVGDYCTITDPLTMKPGYGPCTDIFIAKLSADGSTLRYATYLGGPGLDTATALAVGPAGKLYIAGTAGTPTAFPKLTPLPGQTLTAPFVAELSADGASLLYATSLPAQATAIAADAAGAVYLTGTTSGGLPTVNAFQPTLADADFYKTADHGSHWQAVRNGLPRSMFYTVAADPFDPQVLYVGGGAGLFKSSDSGASWTSILNGIHLQALPLTIAIDPHSPQTLYLGVSDVPGTPGVYQSIDGGATWVASASGITVPYPTISPTWVSYLALDPTNRSILYARTAYGIFKSTDGAASWNSILPLTYGTEGQIVVDPTNGATVYAATLNGVMKSTDGGATWSAMTNGWSGPGPILAADGVAIDPSNPQTLYAGAWASSAIYKTADGGAHWTQVTMLPQTGSPAFLLVDTEFPSRIWAGTATGLFQSLDAGATWNRSAVPHVTVPYLAEDAAGDVYAVNQQGFLVDGFAMKLDATGSHIVYSTYLGGMGRDVPGGIAVDASGRAYIAGETESADFPVANALQPDFAGNSDIFITVLDPGGAHLVWSTFLGGSGAEAATSIAVDAAGDVHLAGVASSGAFLSAFFNPIVDPLARDPTADALAAKIKGDGSAVVYAAHLGGSDFDIASNVAADAAGNTYIAGTTYSKDLSTAYPIQPTLAGTTNLLVAKLNGQTGAVQYATYLGGSQVDYGRGIAADGAGNIYVVSQTTSPDFLLQNPWRSAAGSMTVSKISAQGTGLRLNGLTNAASYTPTVAPGELVSLFGSEMAASGAAAASLPLPLQLSGAQVTVNGVLAPLVYASPQQVNVQIPFETQAGTAQVQVTSSDGAATMTAHVVAAAPAIFTLNQQGTGAGAILHGATYQVVGSANPAAAGEIISIYCTGMGAVNPAAQTGAAPPDPPSQTVIPIQVSIAGVMVPPLYAGVAPGFPGLYQVNAQIPTGTPSGAQALQIIQNGVASNTVTVAIQ